MMNILIVANGKIENKTFYRKLMKNIDITIAADGGADNCIKLGIEPDYVIGDFDSISEKAIKKFKNILIYDKDQDTTDLEKAILLASKVGCKKLTIIGAIGSRMDHTISNIILLLKAKAHSEIFDETNNIFVVEKEIDLKGRKGDIVSVIPISKVSGLRYQGLKWAPKNKNVETGWLGVSNRMTGGKASIRIESGKIIVIKSRD